MKKKSVSIFINSLTAGGAERVVSLLLNELKNDFDIYLFLLYNKIEYQVPEEQKIFCLNQSSKENGIVKLIKLPLLALRYKKFCKQNNIETSLSFLKRANYINCLSRMYGSQSRIIISERTYLTNYLKFVGKTGKLIGKFLTKKLYNKADLIIPNSLLIQSDLENNFNISVKYKVINNPVNLESIQIQSMESVSDALFKIFTFISVGGFRREKNFEMMIDAFDKIKDLDCQLLLIGKGEDEIKLKQKVQRLNLQSKIIFQSFDNNPYKYLSRADCFILSSDFEGFPNSVQEALACNLPVISTDCQSGPREILAPETDIYKILKDDFEIAKYGILVPVKNSNVLANAMRMIYLDKTLLKTLKANAYERAKDFDIGIIAKQFKEILSDN
ncbi:MAG: glycosyltransferase [Bacteroidota bacterium]|nr:glycosyltransferase [Bacteroidota bacterium]